MNAPEVSIILPLHNAGPYLRACLTSIQAQTFERFELIIIDDRSTDGSLNLAEQLAATDPRITIIRNPENLGISATRNVGLQRARTDVVCFCDDDDVMYPNLLEDNLALIQGENVDFVKFGRRLIEDDGRIRDTKFPSTAAEGVVIWQRNQMNAGFDELRSSGAFLNVWNGMYRRDRPELRSIFFDESMRYGGEDHLFSLDYYAASLSMAVNPDIDYVHYKRRGKSTSLAYSPNKVESILRVAERERDIWQRLGPDTDINWYKADYQRRIISTQICMIDSPLSFKERASATRDVMNGPLAIESPSSRPHPLRDRWYLLMVRYRAAFLLAGLYTFRDALRRLRRPRG